MNGYVVRVNLPLNASSSDKKYFKKSIAYLDKMGIAVVRDWKYPAEQEAYILVDKAKSREYVAAYRVKSALTRAFAANYGS